MPTNSNPPKKSPDGDSPRLLNNTLDSQTVVVTTITIRRILAEKYGEQALALYMWLAALSKERHSRQLYATVPYCAKSLSWTQEKLRRARGILLRLGMIEDAPQKDSQGKITRWETVIHFVLEIGGREIHSKDFPGTGKNQSLENPQAYIRNNDYISFKGINDNINIVEAEKTGIDQTHISEEIALKTKPPNNPRTPPPKKFDWETEFENRWKNYPMKDGKRAAKLAFYKQVKSAADLALFDKAFENYKQHLSNNSWKQPKAGKTYFLNWQDFIDWQEPAPISVQTGWDGKPLIGKLAPNGERITKVWDSGSYETANGEKFYLSAEGKYMPVPVSHN